MFLSTLIYLKKESKISGGNIVETLTAINNMADPSDNLNSMTSEQLITLRDQVNGMTSEEINQMLTAGVTEEKRTEILSGLNNEINQRGEITSTTPPVDPTTTTPPVDPTTTTPPVDPTTTTPPVDPTTTTPPVDPTTTTPPVDPTTTTPPVDPTTTTPP